jgi:hypothetical protein
MSSAPASGSDPNLGDPNMSSYKFPQLAPTIFVTALVAACANPRRVDEGPITGMRNGDLVEAPIRANEPTTKVAAAR